MKFSTARAVFRAAIIPLVAGALVQLVFAQAPAAEVTGAYAYPRESDLNFPVGWFADVGFNLTNTLSIVGEIGCSSTGVTRFGTPITLSVTTYQGGVRAIARTPRVSIYAQTLLGFGQFGGTGSAGPVGVSLSFNAVSY